VALAAGERRARRMAVVVAVAVALVAVGIAGAKVGHTSVRKATSDRSRRVELTAKAFAHHPLAGVGLGGQPRASQKLATRFGPLQNFVSNPTPRTVRPGSATAGFPPKAGSSSAPAKVTRAVRPDHMARGRPSAPVSRPF